MAPERGKNPRSLTRNWRSRLTPRNRRLEIGGGGAVHFRGAQPIDGRQPRPISPFRLAWTISTQ
ncbi:Uncharacterised protein [Acinetobacter baumannii]|nr:Uncharacterised protein [Acinetobacter baumannii]